MQIEQVVANVVQALAQKRYENEIVDAHLAACYVYCRDVVIVLPSRKWLDMDNTVGTTQLADNGRSCEVKFASMSSMHNFGTIP